MAQQGNQLDRERIRCSICLDLLKDPVTVPCGHSYCSSCIRGHWDSKCAKNSYSCPQCRGTFSPRPELKKNFVLADLVEELKKTGVRAAPAVHCYAGAEDVACDVCTGRKMKALKSCLVCLASYCEEHLQPHHQSPAFKKHQLVEPSKNLQENICSQHDEVMKLFCRTDQKCICQICCMDQHKGHQVVSAAAERKQKQEELERSGQEIQQNVQYREKDLKVLQQQVDTINVSAETTVQDSEEIFIQMIRVLEEGRSEVKQKIRSLQQRELRGVKEVQEKLQQEIHELKRNDAELKQLLLTQDHNQFLLNWTSRSELSPSAASSRINVRPLRHFEDVTAAVSQLRASLQDLLTQTMRNISETLRPEPETGARSKFRAPQQNLLTQTMRNISETPRPEPETGARSPIRAPQEDILTQTMRNISETPRQEPETRTSSQQRASLQDHLTQTMRNISETLRPNPKTRSKFQLRASQQDHLTETRTNISQTPRPEPETSARSQLRAPQQDFLTQTMRNISEKPRPEPKTRAEFLEYSQEISLDPNTANAHLFLSEGNRRATFKEQVQSYPDHPDRFTDSGPAQVLSRESLTGRCYWEVKITRGRGVFVAVTYKNLNRTDRSSAVFGLNDKSWAFDSLTGELQHNRTSKVLVPGSASSTVGVFLDHRAGLLSFYSVSEPMTLIHRVQTTFTQPLYAGLRFPLYNHGTSVEFCQLIRTETTRC